jgi:hypothetical protein
VGAIYLVFENKGLTLIIRASSLKNKELRILSESIKLSRAREAIVHGGEEAVHVSGVD